MMSSNNSLNASDLRDRLQTLASREGIRRWDLGAACSDDCSVQVDRGEAKQLKASQRSSITVRVWNSDGLVGITSTTDLSDSGLEQALVGAHTASRFGNPEDIPEFSPLATAPLPELDRPLQPRQGILPLLDTLRDAEADLLGRHPAIQTVPYNGLAESLSQSLYLNSEGALRQMERTQASLYLYARAEETGRKPRSGGAVRLGLGSSELDVQGCISEAVDRTVSHLDYRPIETGFDRSIIQMADGAINGLADAALNIQFAAAKTQTNSSSTAGLTTCFLRPRVEIQAGLGALHLAQCSLTVEIEALGQGFRQSVVGDGLDRGVTTQQIGFRIPKGVQQGEDSLARLKWSIELGEWSCGQGGELRDVLGIAKTAGRMGSHQGLLQAAIGEVGGASDSYQAIAVPNPDGDGAPLRCLELFGFTTIHLNGAIVTAGGTKIPTTNAFARGEGLKAIPEIRGVEAVVAAHHQRPPTVIESTLMWGWPTVTNTLPLTDPQNPAASSRSLAHMEMRGITSLASPINVAPFTGLVSLPFSIRYPSSTEKLN